jgi:hypothetical protein
MQSIPSNSRELVRVHPRQLVDEAPLGSIQITVFIMMLIAGIFQGYDNLALAYTAKGLLQRARIDARGIGCSLQRRTVRRYGRGHAVRPTGRSNRSSAGLRCRRLYLGCVHLGHTSRKLHTGAINVQILLRARDRRDSCGHPVVHL